MRREIMTVGDLQLLPPSLTLPLKGEGTKSRSWVELVSKSPLPLGGGLGGGPASLPNICGVIA